MKNVKMNISLEIKPHYYFEDKSSTKRGRDTLAFFRRPNILYPKKCIHA